MTNGGNLLLQGYKAPTAEFGNCQVAIDVINSYDKLVSFSVIACMRKGIYRPDQELNIASINTHTERQNIYRTPSSQDPLSERTIVPSDSKG